jgi:hypothetical protein
MTHSDDRAEHVDHLQFIVDRLRNALELVEGKDAAVIAKEMRATLAEIAELKQQIGGGGDDDIIGRVKKARELRMGEAELCSAENSSHSGREEDVGT